MSTGVDNYSLVAALLKTESSDNWYRETEGLGLETYHRL